MTVTPQWFNVIVTFVPGLFICLFKQTFFALSRHVTLFWESRSFIPAHLPLGHVLNHFSLYHLKQIRASSQIVLVDTLKDERKKNPSILCNFKSKVKNNFQFRAIVVCHQIENGDGTNQMNQSDWQIFNRSQLNGY